MSKSFHKHTIGLEVVNAFLGSVEGRTFVITGTSDPSLGSQTALDLASGSPAALILLARSKKKVDPVIEKVKQINPQIKVQFVEIELDNLESVRKAAQEVNSLLDEIDVLINNAGVMAVPWKLNNAGIESTFATNHLGHFELTSLLMPKIKAAGPDARIVNLSSYGHNIGPFRGNDFNFQDGKVYNRWAAYGQSKTSNILFTQALSQRGITSFAVHPGVIWDTGLALHLNEDDVQAAKEAAKNHAGFDWNLESAKSLAAGSSTTLLAALDPGLKSASGAYLGDCEIVEPQPYATNSENIKQLWDVSEKLVGHKFEV